MRTFVTIAGIAAALACATAGAQGLTSDQKFLSLDGKVQSLKADVLSVGEEIKALEEELLFPPSTQFAVFLAADIDSSIKLVSAQISVDGTVVANHMYDTGQLEALMGGGIQQLHLGNVKTGPHKLSAAYMAKVGKKVSRYTTEYSFNKGKDPVYLELIVQGKDLQEGGKEPRFSAKEWK